MAVDEEELLVAPGAAFAEALSTVLHDTKLTDAEKERVLRLNLAVANGVPQDVAVLEAEVQKSTHQELIRTLGREGAAQAYAEKYTPRTPLAVLTDSDLAARPDPEWWVPGLIQKDTIAELAGPPGILKTFLAIYLSRCLASGMPFLGRQVKKGRTLYVVAEGAASFKKRIRAWDTYYSGNLVRDGWVSYVESGVNLSVESSVDELRDLFRAGDYDVCVIDTYSQLSGVKDENSAAENARVINALRSIREVKAGATVLLVHHTDAKVTKARGSTTLTANVDTIMMCRPSAGGTVTLTTHADQGGKQKDARPETLTGLKLVDVEGTDSAVVTLTTGGDVSPFWEPMRPILADHAWHASAELRQACGIASASGPDYDAWKAYMAGLVRAGSLDREGATRPTYRLIVG